MALNENKGKVIAFERGQVFLAVSSAVAGGIIGWLVPLLFNDKTKIELWAVLAASLLVVTVSAASLGFHNLLHRTSVDSIGIVMSAIETFRSETELKIEYMLAANKKIQLLVEESIGRQAALIPRDLVYREMAISIRNARKEVAIITYLMVDWETGNRTFMPASSDTPFRGEFYEAVYEVIKNPKVGYIRVWEVPHNRRDEAMTVIESDENHRRECALIKELIVADQLTTASFVLIDDKSLFLNIDFFDPSTNVWYSPYMLFIKDASGEAFNELKSIIIRLTGRT
jgi:hypothetical protein